MITLNPRLIQLNATLGGLINLAEPEEKKPGYSIGRKLAIGGGLAAAVTGAALAPAAIPFLRIGARDVVKKGLQKASATKSLGWLVKAPKKDPNEAGRFVADYIEGSQNALNRGVQGKVMGSAIEHMDKNPDGVISKAFGGQEKGLRDFKRGHFAGFRRGTAGALGHWDQEVGWQTENRGLGKSAKWLAGRRTEAAANRVATQDAMNDQMWNHGKNEQEALRHVATTTQDPKIQKHFTDLAINKSKAVGVYTGASLTSPALVVGGVAAAAAALPKKDEKSKLNQLSAKLSELINFKSKSEDPKGGRIIQDVAGAGVLAGGLAVGGTAAHRAIDPTVGIVYGKNNAYRGHLSHAEGVQKLLKGAGIKSEMHNSDGAGFLNQQKHSVEVNTGFGSPVIGSERVKFRADYGGAKDKALPVVPSEVGPATTAGKRTIGVYGGGGGVNIAAKIPHLAQVHHGYHAIHLYAGPKGEKPGYAGGGYEEAQAAVDELRKTNPEAAAKFKVHGSMPRTAIANAISSHSVNIGNAGASTMHEIATSKNPSLIWQSGVYPGAGHFQNNEAWAAKQGTRVAGGVAELRDEDALKHLREIEADHAKATARQTTVAERIVKSGEAERGAFVTQTKDAIRRSVKSNKKIAAIGAGAAVIGSGLLIHANRNRIDKGGKQ